MKEDVMIQKDHFNGKVKTLAASAKVRHHQRVLREMLPNKKSSIRINEKRILRKRGKWGQTAEPNAPVILVDE